MLWRDSLCESEQDYWREQFASARSLKGMREELREKYDLEFTQDGTLRRFIRSVAAQDAREAEAEQVQADTAELLAQGLSGEQLRAALLERMKKRALSGGDFKLGAVAVNLDLKSEALALSQEKFKERRRTNLQAGLAELAKQIKRNPKARAAYEALKAEVASAKR